MSKQSRLLIDLALFVGLLVANDPARTGLATHEWLSIALIVPLLFHLVINWEWAVRITARFFERLFSASRLNLAVDAVLFVSTLAVMVSGLAISSVLTGLLGIANVASPLWVAVHAASASAAVTALVIHFTLHGTWFVRVFPSLFTTRRAPARRPQHGARTVENTMAVLGVTALLATAILLTIGATGALLGVGNSTSVASAAIPGALSGTTGQNGAYLNGSNTANSSGGLRTCPRTGCTASTCHGETGQSPYAQ